MLITVNTNKFLYCHINSFKLYYYRSIYPQGGEFWNGIRGDNTQKDWYVLSMVSATYILDWAVCPKFR